ncbi:spore coat protein U domain-containing protein [Sphingobium tyrosinilyticum]|uniref:Spore coat protein U domain-containing protein n=1 Tax=Sphingobium tyrosinilyticum TaxID=2715436 RepID=A0ABV9EZU2_9SPHN
MVWGDGAATSATVTLSGSSAVIPLYGIVAPRQNVSAGIYQDIIVVSIVH